MRTAVDLKLRASVLECASPLALSFAPRRHKTTQKAPRGNSHSSGVFVRGALLRLFVLFCAFLWQSMFAAEHHIILTINPDGTSVLKTDKTEPRLTVEQQVRMWERYALAREETEDDVKPAKPAEAKPFTD